MDVEPGCKRAADTIAISWKYSRSGLRPGPKEVPGLGTGDPPAVCLCHLWDCLDDRTGRIPPACVGLSPVPSDWIGGGLSGSVGRGDRLARTARSRIGQTNDIHENSPVDVVRLVNLALPSHHFG